MSFDIKAFNANLLKGLEKRNAQPELSPIDKRHWQDLDAIKATEGSVQVQPHWAADAKAYAAEEAQERHESRAAIAPVDHSGGTYEVRQDRPTDPMTPERLASLEGKFSVVSIPHARAYVRGED
ncbi:hypothetical protein NHF40_12525 [Maricaulaceae bacterium EIL42A08]|nr:hypothetical protein [Maricaulaceae bacterium EIL42A08]